MTTTINYNQIKGAPVNVLDYATAASYATIGNRVANDAAFALAVAAAAAAGQKLIVPGGDYYIQGIIWPNVELHMEGEAHTTTVIYCNEPIGCYLGGYANTRGSEGSSIRDITIRTLGATGIRIVNGRTNLFNVLCYGLLSGVEVNSNIAASWDRVYGYGATAGMHVLADHIDTLNNAGAPYATVISNNDTVQQGLYTNCQFTGIAPAGAGSGLRVATTSGYMLYNTFIGMTNENCAVGFDLVSGVSACTFIGCWAEVNATASYREGDATVFGNKYINCYYQVGGGSAAPDLNASAIWDFQNLNYPWSNGGAALGYMKPVGAYFQPWGYAQIAQNVAAGESAIYPSNLVNFSSDTYYKSATERVQQRTFPAGDLDIFRVDLQQPDMTGFFTVTVMGTGTGCIQKTIQWCVSAGTVTFATVGTPYNPTGVMTCVGTSISSTSFKITVGSGGYLNGTPVTVHIKCLTGSSAAANTGGHVLVNI